MLCVKCYIFEKNRLYYMAESRKNKKIEKEENSIQGIMMNVYKVLSK